ncbi:folate-binding protein YgfZ [Corynebacterium sp. LK2510]|uniref:CAF17-like 4Fe-4S cluster assembly/insertion protein YgfZ n=1 Tax=Corynebacterium sp. LK2510 TaxID=3110472 RepID=UPI0034CF0557
MIGAVTEENVVDLLPYRSPLLARDGAAELPDAEASLLDATGVAWHYGDPLGEQHAIAHQPVMVDRSHRRVLRVSGPDAATFLNNLLSQKLIDVTAGFSAAALDLDMQGHILHHVDVYADGSAFYLDMPSYQARSLIDFLERMVFWSEVTIDEADLAILTVLAPAGSGSGSSTALKAVDAVDAVFTRSIPGWGRVDRFDVAVRRDDLTAAADAFVAAGGTLAGLMAFTAERVFAGEPELRADLDEKSIPHEAPMLINRGEHIGAVHLEKGCYRGQETVARVENLGRSPRLLILLHLDGSAPVEPATGAQITLGGRKVGRLGTVVHDADYGPVALALVKRSALGGAGEVTIAGDVEVAARVDPSSLPRDEGDHAGRRAVESLRGRE